MIVEQLSVLAIILASSSYLMNGYWDAKDFRAYISNLVKEGKITRQQAHRELHYNTQLLRVKLFIPAAYILLRKEATKYKKETGIQ